MCGNGTFMIKDKLIKTLLDRLRQCAAPAAMCD